MIVESRPFQMSVIALIGVNMLLMCIPCATCSWYNARTRYIIVVLDATLNCLYVIEIMLKLIAYGWSGFWKHQWNRFDFIVVSLGVAGIIVDFVLSSDSSTG